MIHARYDVHRLRRRASQAGFGIIAGGERCRQRRIMSRCCIAGIYASNAVELKETVSIAPKNDRQGQKRLQDQNADGQR